MELFVSIVNNAWFIGIVGSILSGLFTYWLTKTIFSKKDNKEYLQKVNTVNNEIIYALRLGISEESLPSYHVINRLINATCRKQGVRVKDVYTYNEIIEDLTKEVMDSSFISSENKAKYCELLSSSLDKFNDENSPIEHIENLKLLLKLESKSKVTSDISFIFAVFATIFTLLITLKSKLGDRILTALSDLRYIDNLIPALLSMTIVLITSFIFILYSKIRKIRTDSKITDVDIKKTDNEYDCK